MLSCLRSMKSFGGLICFISARATSLPALATAAPTRGACGSESCGDSTRKGASLLQTRLFTSETTSGQKQESCIDLENRGSYFSVNVSAGTPPQNFSLVADTGSDSVILTSCVCLKMGYCDKKDGRCFLGTNRSSTFSVDDGEHGLPSLQITFGSGPIQAVVASDIVQLGQEKVMMQDGLLLMVDRRKLDISGKFEGILGLGLPRPENSSGLHKTASKDLTYGSKGFLQEAGVERFSICFNDGNGSGALRLNTPPTDGMGSMGTFHWGLGLEGISVGPHGNPGTFFPLALCNKNQMRVGQETPCGAIPDTGTTLMMGPSGQIQQVVESICDHWPRCKRTYDADVAVLGSFFTSKANVFQKVLLKCADWLNDGDGLYELPDIHFKLRGHGGKEQTITLTGWSYVTEMRQHVYKKEYKYLFGFLPIEFDTDTGKYEKVCTHGFGVQEYDTHTNGPVWIMGTPLFYEHTVGYDMATKPPAVSFTKGSCASCGSNDNTTLLLSTSSARRKPRETHGPPRFPTVDVRLPL